MTKEIWNDVVEYHGVYEVSTKGNVRRISNKRVLKNSVTLGGYVRVPLCKLGKVKRKFVHRIVAESFLPKELGKNYVNHINCIRTDNRIKNLEWVTTQENIDYCVSLRRHARGETSGMSKLKNSDIEYIRNFILNNGVKYGTYTYLGDILKIHRTIVSKIHRKLLWNHR